MDKSHFSPTVNSARFSPVVVLTLLMICVQFISLPLKAQDTVSTTGVQFSDAPNTAAAVKPAPAADSKGRKINKVAEKKPLKNRRNKHYGRYF